MIPAAFNARLHNVCVELFGTGVQLTHLLGGRDTSALGRKPRPKDIRDQLQVGLLTDRTSRVGLRADVLRRPNQFGMRITHLIKRKPSLFDLADEHPASEAVIDDATRSVGAAERTDRETHGHEG